MSLCKLGVGCVCGVRVCVYVEACVSSCVCLCLMIETNQTFRLNAFFIVNSTFVIWSCCSNIIAKQILEFVFLKILILILAIKTVWLIFLMFSFTHDFCFPNIMCVRCIFYSNGTFSLDSSFNKSPKMLHNWTFSTKMLKYMNHVSTVWTFAVFPYFHLRQKHISCINILPLKHLWFKNVKSANFFVSFLF